MTTMTPDEIEVLSNEVRLQLQHRTCCPQHAGEVLVRVMASFALDDAGDNPARAARDIERAGKRLAKRIRRGELAMVRKMQ